MLPIGLNDLCSQYGLDAKQCQKIRESALAECPVNVVEKKSPRASSGRRLSRWQECIKTRRAGKGFDPQAISDLAKEYREGRCP